MHFHNKYIYALVFSVGFSFVFMFMMVFGTHFHCIWNHKHIITKPYACAIATNPIPNRLSDTPTKSMLLYIWIWLSFGVVCLEFSMEQVRFLSLFVLGESNVLEMTIFTHTKKSTNKTNVGIIWINCVLPGVCVHFQWQTVSLFRIEAENSEMSRRKVNRVSVQALLY